MFQVDPKWEDVRWQPRRTFRGIAIDSLNTGPIMIKFRTAMTVYATLVFLGLPVASWETQAPDSPKSQNVLDEIRQHDDGLAIWWTGHNGWLIKSDGLLLGIDLVLDDQSREYASPISAAELAGELDISFITHGHGDHFNAPTSRVLAKKSKCLFVLPRNCLEKARGGSGVQRTAIRGRIRALGGARSAQRPSPNAASA